MGPTREEIDRRLLAYLADAEGNKRAGYTPEALHAAVANIAQRQIDHEAKDVERFAELRGDFKGLGLRVGSIERDVEKLQRSAEDTGRHEIERIARERDKLESVVDEVEKGKRDDRSWLTRHGISVATGILAAAVTTAIGLAIAASFGEGQKAHPTPHHDDTTAEGARR